MLTPHLSVRNPTCAVQAGSSAVPGKDSAANPYSAVLTGLQSLLDGPLFKEQQPSQEVIAAALRAAGHPEAAAEAEQEAAEDEDEEAEELTAAVVSPAARSPPGSRRPRKRQAATSSQVGPLPTRIAVCADDELKYRWMLDHHYAIACAACGACCAGVHPEAVV